VGLNTALCRRSLLSIDGVDSLPSSRCICFAFKWSRFLLVLMCFAHVKSSIEMDTQVFHFIFLG
jgi:hypothetical protein